MWADCDSVIEGDLSTFIASSILLRRCSRALSDSFWDTDGGFLTDVHGIAAESIEEVMVSCVEDGTIELDEKFLLMEFKPDLTCFVWLAIIRFD